MSHVLQRIRDQAQEISDARERSRRRLQAIADGQNPEARRFLEDPAPLRALRCPRRSGKSYALTSAALDQGERKDRARVLIISITLKSTKQNFWAAAPGGIHSQNAQYDLGLRFNATDVSWTHENGSYGRLAGAETMADIENLRGAPAEVDLAIVDECKSFAPDLLDALIRDVLEPGLMTRNGRLVLAGTPGSIPAGRFWEATFPLARVNSEHVWTGELWRPEQDDETGSAPSCVPYELRDEPFYRTLPAGDQAGVHDDPRDDLFSLHSWSIRDNRAAPWQWRRALANKRRNGWADDNPTWRREYLGEWVTDRLDLVYLYASRRVEPGAPSVTWNPNPTRENPAGLPLDLGPWHLVMGLDFGVEDPCAIFLGAWSETVQELRHVADFKRSHLVIEQFAEEIFRFFDLYGRPEVVVGDAGALGKMIVDSMNARYGLGIQAAEKRFKFDHVELLNSDFHSGRVRIIPGTALEHELLALQWDLSGDSKERLAKLKKLREDPSCANHLCDALLYSWRYCHHFWARPRYLGPERGTEDWHRLQDTRALAAALSRRRLGAADPHGLTRIRRTERPLTREDPRLWKT